MRTSILELLEPLPAAHTVCRFEPYQLLILFARIDLATSWCYLQDTDWWYTRFALACAVHKGSSWLDKMKPRGPTQVCGKYGMVNPVKMWCQRSLTDFSFDSGVLWQKKRRSNYFPPNKLCTLNLWCVEDIWAQQNLGRSHRYCDSPQIGLIPI